MYKNIQSIPVGRLDEIIVLIKAINELKTKSGAPYQKIIVRDMDGNEASFLKFDILTQIQPPAIAKMSVECVEYGASLAFKVKDCAITDEVGLDEFLPKAHIEPKDGWGQVIKLTKTIRNSLCRVVCAILTNDKNKLMTLPLNATGAFARQSGNLEATIKLATLADATAKQQGLDRDLMVTAALLYYNGNLDTLDEGYMNTVADLMYGPSITGYTKVQMKSAELIANNEDARNEINGEDIMLLSHILAVKGGSVEPVIPEAVAMKQLDIMIQQVDDMYERIAVAETPITVDEYNTNNRVYKRSNQLN